jgi:alkane 1-monooxygenase
VDSNSSQKPSLRGKYRHIAFCCLPQLLFVLLALAVFARGYWLLLPLVFLLGVAPLLDLLTGWQDSDHFEPGDFSPAELSLLHWNTRFYAVFYMTAVTWLAFSIHRFTATEIALLIGTCSLLGGICFAAAHELLHAKEKTDQVLQRITTAFLFYPHYKLIHIRSHHVHTSTPQDENTAWFNESVYAYIFRTIPGSAIRSWQMEVRQQGGGERSGGMGLLRNKMVSYAAGQVVLLLALYLLSGPWGLLFYLVQTVGAHVVVESVNYIQHYGLLRRQREGEYEKPGPEHSWDTYHFFSSYLTFRVGHHSYHHIAVKPYYVLGTEPQAPKLPAGYFWSIPMALLPPCWRRVINPKLKIHPQPESGLAALAHE